MLEESRNIYREIAERTGGDIYIGVVGPVRTGKSTFVKRVMEALVIPNIENIYQRERAKDELPQSGSGKTIMTSEPKFVPEEAVSISPDGKATLSVRMIDSVGYMIPGAIGGEEEGKPRMVTTPWFDREIPMTEAAELGTKKIMEDHCSVGIVMTTDGSVTDIPREDYLQAEARAVADMKATGKPFLVLLNTEDPTSAMAAEMAKDLEKRYNTRVLPVNCLTLQEESICHILLELLYEFPVMQICYYLPGWLQALAVDHPWKQQLFSAMQEISSEASTLREAEQAIRKMNELEIVNSLELETVDPGSGAVGCQLHFPQHLFYEVLSEHCGVSLGNDADLLRLLAELSEIKREHDKIAAALEEVRATGYGIVLPTSEEMRLEVPQIVRKGGSYGVKMKASAPSIHMLRADIETEISPIVGDEKQSEDLLHYLLSEYESDPDKLWSSNIFGKSVFELVSDGLGTKLRKMPEEARFKLQTTLSRIINEGSSGLLCIILA